MSRRQQPSTLQRLIDLEAVALAEALEAVRLAHRKGLS